MIELCPTETSCPKPLRDWIDAVSTARGEPDEVLELYAADATLIPTMAPGPLRMHDGGIEGYFRFFTGLPRLEATVEQCFTQQQGTTAITAGLYVFRYEDPDGRAMDAAARFSFVYRLAGEKWEIIHHHSSAIPATP